MSKKSDSQVIYKRMIKQGKTKAEIVSVFISEAGLTPGGANTYFLSRKKEFNTETGEFNSPTIAPKSTPSEPRHSATVTAMPDSKANSGDNIDKRQVYSLAFKGEDDSISSMECSFNVLELKTRQKVSNKDCIVIKGIGKEDLNDQVYSKLKSIA